MQNQNQQQQQITTLDTPFTFVLLKKSHLPSDCSLPLHFSFCFSDNTS